jgi:hypothetical protein
MALVRADHVQNAGAFLYGPLSPSELAGLPQLQLSIVWREFNPASQSCWYGKIRIRNTSLPSSAPHRRRYFAQGFVQPSSRSPQSA